MPMWGCEILASHSGNIAARKTVKRRTQGAQRGAVGRHHQGWEISLQRLDLKPVEGQAADEQDRIVRTRLETMVLM